MSEVPERHVIALPRPASGQEIMDVIKMAVITPRVDQSAKYIKVGQGRVGNYVYLNGQWSQLAENHVIVGAAINSLHINPKVMYSSVVVMGYEWNNGIAVESNNAAVRALTHKLKRYFSSKLGVSSNN